MKWSAIAVIECVSVCVLIVSCGQTVRRWNRIFWILVYLYTWYEVVQSEFRQRSHNCQFTDEVGLRKKIIKASKQAINIVFTRRRGRRYKLWRGAWLEEAASVTHSESVVWLITAWGRPHRRGRHYTSAALCSQPGEMVLLDIKQRNELHTAKYLWPFLCLFLSVFSWTYLQPKPHVRF
jgi:hypothetical protein